MDLCLKPRELLKNLEGTSLTRTENCTVDIHCAINIPFLPKTFTPINTTETSNSKSNLQNKLGIPYRIRLSIYSLTINTEYPMYLSPLQNAFCEFEMIFSNTVFNLFASTLHSDLYIPPTKLKRRKSLISSDPQH